MSPRSKKIRKVANVSTPTLRSAPKRDMITMSVPSDWHLETQIFCVFCRNHLWRAYVCFAGCRSSALISFVYLRSLTSTSIAPVVTALHFTDFPAFDSFQKHTTLKNYAFQVPLGSCTGTVRLQSSKSTNLEILNVVDKFEIFYSSFNLAFLSKN